MALVVEYMHSCHCKKIGGSFNPDPEMSSQFQSGFVQVVIDPPPVAMV